MTDEPEFENWKEQTELSTGQPWRNAMRCGDCKFSQEVNPCEFQGYMLVCNGVRERWGIEDDHKKESGPWDNTDAWQESRKLAFINELAFVEDGSTYYAALVVHPDFFCAKFRPK